VWCNGSSKDHSISVDSKFERLRIRSLHFTTSAKKRDDATTSYDDRPTLFTARSDACGRVHRPDSAQSRLRLPSKEGQDTALMPRFKMSQFNVL
jgi:hypothetical protein